MPRVESGSDGRLGGAVIAGGHSRRMDRDKRLVPVGGVPLLTRAVRAMRAVTPDVVVVTAPGNLPPEAVRDGAPVVTDQRVDAGPAAGLEAALTHLADRDAVVVLAGDHPWAVPAVLRLLADTLLARPDAEVALLAGTQRPEPLVAAYRPAARERMAPLLDGGERRLVGLLDHLAPVLVPEEDWRTLDPEGWTLRDVDEPGDLEGVT